MLTNVGFSLLIFADFKENRWKTLGFTEEFRLEFSLVS